MLIQPCAVRASRPAAAGTTEGSPSLHRRFRHASRAPPARHASRRPRSGRVAPTRRGQPSPGAGAVEWGRACGTGAAPAAARGARAARGGRGRRTARSFRQPPWLPRCRERDFQGCRFSSFSPRRASGEPSLLEPQQTLAVCCPGSLLAKPARTNFVLACQSIWKHGSRSWYNLIDEADKVCTGCFLSNRALQFLSQQLCVNNNKLCVHMCAPWRRTLAYHSL